MTTRRGSARVPRAPVPAASSRTPSGSSSCSSGWSAAWTTAGIARVGHRDRALEQDRPGVDALVHEVDRDADDLHAVVDRLLDRPDARERGQQRRVDVDDAVGESRHERGRQQRHVAGQDDELGALRDAPSRPSPRRAPCGPRSRRGGRRPSGSLPLAARSSAGAPARSDATPTISISRPWTVSMSAWRFDPRPDTSTTTRTSGTLRRRGELREPAARRARAGPRRAARRRAPGRRRRGRPRRPRRRAARRSRAGRRPSSARRAGSPRRGCGRPTAGRARRRRGSRRRGRRGRPRGCSRRSRAGACRPPRETTIDVTSATDSGAQTSQQATIGAGVAGSPKWRRIAARRQPSSSTNAQIERYWRQRARVPSAAEVRQVARARPSYGASIRPRTRSIGAGAGRRTPGAHEVPDDRADLVGLGAQPAGVDVEAPVGRATRAGARRRGRSPRRTARRAR